MRGLCSSFLALFVLASCTIAAATEYPKPRCGGVFDLCGYVDADGAERIARQFQKARPFQDGLAAVRIDGLWGYIDPSGKLTIEPQYLAVSAFRGNRAEAATADGVGVLDRNGTFIIPPRFGRAIPFTDDVALISERRLSAYELRLGILGHDHLLRRYRLLHRTKGWLTESAHAFRWFKRPRDGAGDKIWASVTGSRKKFGLMDARGAWVVTPRYDRVQPLLDDRAVVAGPDGSGAVDGSGRVVIPLEHKLLSYFENGYAIVGGPGPYQTRKEGLIRADGSVVVAPIFDKVERPRAGGRPHVKRDGLWYRVESAGGVNPTLERTVPDGTVLLSCPQGLRIEQHSTGLLVTNSAGELVLQEPADRFSSGSGSTHLSNAGRVLKYSDPDCEAPIHVSYGDPQDGTYRATYVKPNGRLLFDPPRFFSSTTRFQRGHAIVGTAGPGQTGNGGIIDTEGRFTLPPGPEAFHFDRFVSELAGSATFRIVQSNNGRLMDAHGNPVPEVIESLDQQRREQAVNCSSGARIMGDGERFGIVGPDGTILVPAVHRAISCFRNGLAWAPRESLKQWCPIGPDGRFRDTPACSQTYYPDWRTNSRPERFSDNDYESSVLWVRAKNRYGLGLRNQAPAWEAGGQW